MDSRAIDFLCRQDPANPWTQSPLWVLWESQKEGNPVARFYHLKSQPSAVTETSTSSTYAVKRLPPDLEVQKAILNILREYPQAEVVGEVDFSTPPESNIYRLKTLRIKATDHSSLHPTLVQRFLFPNMEEELPQPQFGDIRFIEGMPIRHQWLDAYWKAEEKRQGQDIPDATRKWAHPRYEKLVGRLEEAYGLNQPHAEGDHPIPLTVPQA